MTTRTKYKSWTNSEVRRMKAMRESGMTWPEIGKKLKRTGASCAAKGRYVGFELLPATRSRWTDEHDAMIVAGLSALSEIIGKPTSTIASRVNSLLTGGYFP